MSKVFRSKIISMPGTRTTSQIKATDVTLEYASMTKERLFQKFWESKTILISFSTSRLLRTLYKSDQHKQNLLFPTKDQHNHNHQCIDKRSEEHILIRKIHSMTKSTTT